MSIVRGALGQEKIGGREMTDFLAIARREIEAGIPVIPIRAGEKGPPLVSGGTTSASTDLEQVTKWAAQFPDANVGVVCRLDGILIVDDDECVIEKSGIPVRTRVVESSPGHRQFYFRQTAATAEAGNLSQRAGFSLRANNYYGLAAGSQHPDGHLYKLLVDAEIQPMPEELLRYLQQKYNEASPRTLEGNQVAAWGELSRKIGEGEGRNDDMTRLAGLIWNGDLEEEDFVAALLRQCELRHDPAYSEARVRELVQRAMKDWKPAVNGPEWEDLFDVPEEERGYWIKLTWYRTKDAYYSALGKAAHEAKAQEKVIIGPELCEGFEYVVAPDPKNNDDPDNFEGWFPLGEVSLVFGSSGAGKTTWSIQLLKAQEQGQPFFEHDTYRLPWVMLMKDRSKNAAKRTFRRMKLDPASLPLRQWPEGKADVARQVELVYLAEAVKPRIVFIEGLDLMVTKGKDSDAWVPILEGLAAVALRYNLAIIATVGSPKQKIKEHYDAPRDSAFGSQAVARMVETMVYVQEDYSTGDRIITVMPRNARQERMGLAIRKGVLVEVGIVVQIPDAKKLKFMAWWAEGATWEQAKGTFGEQFAESTFYKWAKEAKELESKKTP